MKKIRCRYISTFVVLVIFFYGTPVFSEPTQEEQQNNSVSVRDVATAKSQAAMATTEQAVLADAALMENIKQLANDPDVVAILTDPKLKDAILRKDVESLKNDEKFLKFMDNPAVKKITADAMALQNKNKENSK
jgi:hypothetical protein